MSLYLVLEEDSSKAVEQLEWGHDLALNQYASYHSSCRPVSRHHWHLEKPSILPLAKALSLLKSSVVRLQGESALSHPNITASHHVHSEVVGL